MYATLMLLAILLNGLNIAATYVLVRSQRYDRHQKLFQAALIWLVPVVGSLLVWSLARDKSTSPITTDLADRAGLNGHKIPDGAGEGIGRE